MAGVPDGELDMGTRLEGWVTLGKVRVEVDRSELEIEHTPLVAHRVRGVGAQVEEDLVHLGRIGQDHGGGGVRELTKVDGGGKGRPQEVFDLVDDRLERHRAALGFSPAAEREDLSDEVRGALRCGQEVPQMVLRGEAFGMRIAASSASPAMMPKRLLKSWAMPPAKVPMASIFWACLTWASRPSAG